jgi:hypothetical protein
MQRYLIVSDVLGEPNCPIFKGEIDYPETPVTTSQHSVITLQKTKDLF